MVRSAGINFKLNSNVVLKADCQQFSGDYPAAGDQNRFDPGLGLDFQPAR